MKGKRLIDPVTGRVEGDEDEHSQDSFEAVERESANGKRAKMYDQS